MKNNSRKNQLYRLIKYTFLLSLIIISSCYANQKELAYNQLKKLFIDKNKDLISHFPSKIDFNNALFNGQMIYEGENENNFGAYIHLIVFNASSEIDEFYKRNYKILAKINPQDSCNLIVPWFSPFHHTIAEFDSCYDRLIKNCNNISLPIPNFANETELLQIDGIRLPIDFKIYLLEIDKNKPFDYSYKYAGHGLPTEWKNGYSKGVAISEERKIIIYWFDAW